MMTKFVTLLLFIAVAFLGFFYGKTHDISFLKKPAAIETKEAPTEEDLKEFREVALPQLGTKEFTKEEFKAFRAALREETLSEDPRIALQSLRGALLEGKIHKDCHNLTHEIGHAAYEKYKDPVEAFQYKENVCGFGYIHGVTESYVENTAKPLKTMSVVCNGYEEGRDKQECYHAVGHAAMIYSGNNLPEAIQLCDTFSSDEVKAACGQGVFMENFSSDEDHRTDFVKEEDPFYPCQNQEEVYKSYCYKMAPIYYLSVHQNDFSKILEWCNTAETEYKGDCTRGANSLFIQYARNSSLIEKFCLSGEPLQREPCLREYVRVKLFTHSREEMKSLCYTELRYEASRSICMEAAVTEIKNN